MADKFRALLVTKDGNRQSVAVTELTDADLMEGDVTVAVEHSTVNYKDGLAITGKAPIIRKLPLIPGIDKMVRPAPCNPRIAVSRPDPGPFTNTCTCFTPTSMAFLAAVSAVI